MPWMLSQFQGLIPIQGSDSLWSYHSAVIYGLVPTPWTAPRRLCWRCRWQIALWSSSCLVLLACTLILGRNPEQTSGSLRLTSCCTSARSKSRSCPVWYLQIVSEERSLLTFSFLGDQIPQKVNGTYVFWRQVGADVDRHERVDLVLRSELSCELLGCQLLGIRSWNLHLCILSFNYNLV